LKPALWAIVVLPWVLTALFVQTRVHRERREAAEIRRLHEYLKRMERW